MFGRLGRAASGNEHRQIAPIGLIRPVQVVVYTASAFILPALAVAVEVSNRRRIGVGVVKRLYLIRRLLFITCHFLSAVLIPVMSDQKSMGTCRRRSLTDDWKLLTEQ